MAVLDVKRRFLFVHTYKTGGTSIVTLLNGNLYVPQHAPASFLKRQISKDRGEAFYNSLFTFAFCRNPYTWLASARNYWRKAPNKNFKHIDTTSLRTYLDCVKAEKYCSDGDNFNFLGTQKYFIEGVEKVYRFEEMAEAMDDLRGRYNLTGPNWHLNKIVYDTPIIEQYDEEVLALVNDMYREDFKHFGYKMAYNLKELKEILTNTSL